MKILFADGTRGFSPRRLQAQPTGGISTSLTMIPKVLAAKGHEVYVKSLHDVDERVEGVNFIKRETPSPSVDIVVFNRNMLQIDNLNAAKRAGAVAVWWLHDIVDHRYMQDDSFKRVNHVVALSDYCRDTYVDFYGMNRDAFTVIPNGVDRSIWYPGGYDDRDRNLFIYASAPVKGFKPLQFVLHNLRRQLPGLDFRIYSSQKLHDLKDSPQIKQWHAGMIQAGATVREPVSQPELAGIFRKAWALLMPNDYPEICSNLILQAQACGLPVVTSPIGSAPEFIKNGETGLLTDYQPHDLYMWWTDFARKVMDLYRDHELHRRISVHAVGVPKDWTGIGERWEEYANQLRPEADRLLGVL